MRQRDSKTARSTDREQVHFNISRDLLDKVDAEADANEIGRSAQIRIIIIEWLGKRNTVDATTQPQNS